MKQLKLVSYLFYLIFIVSFLLSFSSIDNRQNFIKCFTDVRTESKIISIWVYMYIICVIIIPIINFIYIEFKNRHKNLSNSYYILIYLFSHFSNIFVMLMIGISPFYGYHDSFLDFSFVHLTQPLYIINNILSVISFIFIVLSVVLKCSSKKLNIISSETTINLLIILNIYNIITLLNPFILYTNFLFILM